MKALNQTFANVQVSKPRADANLQVVEMGGFAWSNQQGIVHQAISVDPGNPDSWFGTN